MTTRLETLKSSDVQVAPEEKEVIEKSYTKNLKEWRKRKRYVRRPCNVFGTLSVECARMLFYFGESSIVSSSRLLPYVSSINRPKMF